MSSYILFMAHCGLVYLYVPYNKPLRLVGVRYSVTPFARNNPDYALLFADQDMYSPFCAYLFFGPARADSTAVQRSQSSVDPLLDDGGGRQCL
ncbi:hypothetical protein AB1N83_009749 [Pleurotus pulmonarius]